jgi:Putative Actinobacterial Holin-X, holin superfamily III
VNEGGDDMAEKRESSDVPPTNQSTLELVRSIGNDTATLVRKEIELGRQEIVEAVTARLKAAAAFGAAGFLGLFATIFLAVAAGAALKLVVAPWLAWLIVGGSFLLLAGAAAASGVARIKKPAMKPEETVRTVKEDVEWAKAQLKR